MKPETPQNTWPPAPKGEIAVSIQEGPFLIGSSAGDKRFGAVMAFVLIGAPVLGQSAWFQYQSGRLFIAGFDLSLLNTPEFFLVTFAPLLIGIVVFVGCLLLFHLTSPTAANSFRASLLAAWLIVSSVSTAYDYFA